jgi:hypothetical protein
MLLEDECGFVVHDKANFMRQEMTSEWPAVQGPML